MDPNRPPSADSVHLQEDALNASLPQTGVDQNGNWLDTSSLEGNEPVRVHAQNEVIPIQAHSEHVLSSRALMMKRRSIVVSLAVTIVVTLVTGASILALTRQTAKQTSDNQTAKSQDVKLNNAAIDNLPDELQGTAESLLVNGDLITRGEIKISKNGYVTVLRSQDPTSNQAFTLPNGSGTLCLDNNNCSFAPQAGLNQTNNAVAALRAQLGQIAVPSVPASSLVNNQAGAVAIQGTSNQISVSTASGTITLAGPQDLAPISSPTFAGLVLTGNLSLAGTLTLPTDCSALTNGGALTTDGSGNIVCSSDDGGVASGNVSTSVGGTAGTIPVFTSGQNIENSLISQALGTVTVNGALVANSLSLSSALSVPNGGTGATSLAADGVLVGNGASPVSSVTAGGSGLCLVSTAGAPAFQACPGSGGVSSLNTQTGAVTVQGTANQINVVTASGTVTLSTPQAINSTASPTFAGLTISGLGNGVVRSSSGVLSNGTVNLASEVNGTLPLANGGTGVTTTPTNGQLLVGNGSGYSISTVTAGAGINVVNGAGSITISAPGSGTCSTCADRTLNNLSSVAINTSLLTDSSGVDLGSNLKAFQDLYLTGSGSGTFRFTGSPSSNQTLTFPDATDTVCLLALANCAGTGGGVTSGGGTSGKLAKFTGSTTIGDSLLSESGALVTLAGSLTINSNLTVSGILTSGTVNGLTLQANTNGFHISGGATPATLTVTTNTTLNQNLRTTDSPTFAGLSLSAPLTIGNGGTGVSSTPTNGQLLIGNGSGFTINTLTAGSGVTITNSSGGITVAAPAAGSCPTTCADRSLSNLSGLNINTTLLPDNTQTVNLGSTTRPFQSLRLNSTAGAQGFLITGTNAGAEVTLTLPTLNGTLALVQTAGSSSAQSGDLNIGGNIIGTRVMSTLLGSSDTTSTSNVILRSGNASAGNSGSVTIDAGTATGTMGGITIAGTNAGSLQLGRSGLQVNIPGGLTTSNGNIALGSGTLTTTGSITSGDVNGQTVSSAANFTGTLAIQGSNALSLGTASSNTGAIIFSNSSGANTVALRASNTNPGSSFSLTLPSALPGGTECLNLAASGQIGTQSCSSGLGGSGTAGTVALFDVGGNSVADSLLTQSGNVVSILGTTNSLSVNGSMTTGLNGASGVVGSLILNDGSNPGRAVTVQSQQVGSSYTLQLPTTADVGSTCLILSSVGGGVNKITGGSCAAGGSGGNVNLSGSVSGYILRGTGNGPSYTAAASLLQDDGNTVAVNTTPQSDLFTVGSSNAFRVTDAGAISASSSITSSGIVQTSATGQALTVSGTPTNSATQSLVRIGGAIAGGNTLTDGGTYLGLNAPNSGVGSAADFINLQKNSVSRFKVDNTGAITAGTYNGLTLSQAAGQFSMQGGTGTARTLSVTADSTINQNLATGSSVSFGSLALTSSALAPAYGGTGILGGPTADGQLLIGSSGGTYTRAQLTAGAGINISNGAGTISISAPGSGTCTNCSDRQLSNLTGTVAIPVDLLGVTAGTINIGSSSVPFRNLYLAGTSASPGTNNFTITGVATGARTLTLPDASGTICIDTGNCAGAGGGITGSGTNNTVPKFTGSGTIGNSNITDNGTTVGITGALTVSTTAAITGTLTASTFNALSLQANTTGFQISGGTTSRTLIVENNSALNQNLRDTDSPTFASLSLTAPLTVGNGGTGIAGGPSANGQLLIGSAGGTYTRATLTAGSGVNISNGAGSITISSPSAGSCSTCADTALSNVASTAVGSSLIAGVTNNIDLGSSGFTWRTGYYGTSVITPTVQGTTTLALTSGAGSNLSITSGTTGIASLDSGSTGDVNVGTNGNAKTVTIGNITGATGVVINTGTNGVNIGDNAVTKTIDVGGNDANATDTVRIATNATSADTITVGNSHSSTMATFTGGAYNLNIRNTGIGINATTPTTGSVDLFFGQGANRMINVNQASSGAGNSLTIAAGQGASGANAGGNLVLQGGAQGTSGGSGSVIVRANGTESTTAFQIQNSSSTALFTANTTTSGVNGGVLQVGSSTTNGTGVLFVLDSFDNTGAAEAGLTTAKGSMYYNTSTNKFRCYENTAWKDCDVSSTGTPRTKKVSLKPEFDGVILRADGTSNTGTMTSDLCSGSSRLNIPSSSNPCGATEEHSYYEWTTSEASAQDYDVYVRWRIPSDFNDASGFQSNISFAMNGWRTDSSNSILVNMYNDVGAVCGTADQVVASGTAAWTSLSFAGMAADADCDNTKMDVDDYVWLRFRMNSDSGEFSRLGEIEITYTSAY